MHTETVPQHYSSNPDEPVWFYGGPFSNFVGGPFQIESDQPWAPDDHHYTAEYRTIEHFFQASKAITREAHDMIRAQRGPGDAKRQGRMTPLRPDWEESKYEIMMCGLRVKFRDSFYRAELLATGNREIAEDSPTDFVWGIRDESGGLGGQNLLGRALMELRSEIRTAS
jgi:N-glycosidase YbiA